MRFCYHSRATGVVRLLFNSSLICSFIVAPLHIQAQARDGSADQLAPPQITSPLTGFKGKALLVLSEGDQSATAYADGLLDRPDGVADSLTILSCPPDQAGIIRALPVSNSVLGWPQALAVAPDGKHAYVVETRSAPQMGKVKNVLKALPDGHTLTTVDLTDIMAPKIVDQRSVGVNPWTVDASPDGKTLAVDTRQQDANLLLIDLVNGMPGAVRKLCIKDHLGHKISVNSVRWSPVGNLLALNLNDKELAFMDVKRLADGAVDSSAIVARIPKAGKQITPGKFSPDGRFYMMTDLNCGKSPLAYLFNGKGRFVVVTTPLIVNEKPHIILRTATGITPEGFDLSPDGTLLASVNMAHCFLPKTALFKLVPAQKTCSISVSKFDPVTRTLTKSLAVPFDGLLPRHLAFDDSGKYLVATVFQNTSKPANKGRLQFFQIMEDGTRRVEACKLGLTLPRGAHTIELLR